MVNDREQAQNIIALVNRYILGKEEAVTEVMTALLAGGHILLEDIPGVGKTKMASVFARALGLEWKRVQFTPDVMPSDLTGFSVYRKDIEKFVYRKGCVFCNLLLADELNRTTPKTQSALLEAMEERQVTAEGVTRVLTPPFLVIATENPLGNAGTQPLPAAQLDRFMISMTIGYPDFEHEVRMAKEIETQLPAEQIAPVTNRQTFLNMQEEVQSVHISDEVYGYIVKLITETRDHPQLEYGASPRATIALVKTSQAAAWLEGSAYVTPTHVAKQFPYVVTHRISCNVNARMEGIKKEDIIADILKQVEKPRPGRS